MSSRAAWLGMALVAGCASVPAKGPVQVDVQDGAITAPAVHAPRARPEGSPAEPLFDAEVELRTRAAYFGALYARPPGRGVVPLNPAHTRQAAPFDIYPWAVVEARDASLRVRIEHSDATLVLYVPREDLVVVAKRTTRLTLSPDDGAGDEGVFVRSGTALSGERSHGRMHVSIEDAGVTVEGTLPTTAVGQAYMPDERELSMGRDLLPGTIVRRSDGRRLLTTGTEAWPVEVTAEREGERAIAFRGARLEVRGWVDAEALTPPRTRGFSSACRLGVGFRAGHPRVLHYGDRLREPDSRTIFGRITRRRVPVTDVGGQGKGRRVHLQLLPHGRFDAWVDETDLAFGDRFEAAYAAQVEMTAASKTKLPSELLKRRPRLVGCVELARAEGRTKPVLLQLTWGGDRIDVPPHGLRAGLRDCIQSELFEIDNPPAQPVPFTLRLDPKPLPTRGETAN